MKSTNDKIDEILEGLAQGERSWIHDQLDGTSMVQENLEAVDKDVLRAKFRLIQTIKETLQECIGTMENTESNKPHGDVRNQLRKEALNKLDSLLDPQED